MGEGHSRSVSAEITFLAVSAPSGFRGLGFSEVFRV